MLLTKVDIIDVSQQDSIVEHIILERSDPQFFYRALSMGGVFYYGSVTNIGLWAGLISP